MDKAAHYEQSCVLNKRLESGASPVNCFALEVVGQFENHKIFSGNIRSSVPGLNTDM
jgi:hypothetical protein